MYSGVGRLLSPKYNRSTPSMVMAISASSRMRERGTLWTDVAIQGILPFSHCARPKLRAPRLIMSFHASTLSSSRHYRRVFAGHRNRRTLHDRVGDDGRRTPYGVRKEYRRFE